jgi:hypothetical protein
VDLPVKTGIVLGVMVGGLLVGCQQPPPPKAPIMGTPNPARANRWPNARKSGTVMMPAGSQSGQKPTR